jgi:hypothetical protein
VKRCCYDERAMRALALSLAVALLPACATESLPEPEPTMITPGAFIAEDPEDGPIALVRTLDTFKTEADVVLALTEYDVEPASFEEAAELARLPELPIRYTITAASAKLLAASEHRVVWYRTLTDEERARAD